MKFIVVIFIIMANVVMEDMHYFTEKYTYQSIIMAVKVVKYANDHPP